MSGHKKTPNVQQHVEGQTSETESLTNDCHKRPSFAGRQAQATGEAGRNAPLGAPALPDAASGGAAALPCLKSNNSIMNPLGLESGGSLKEESKESEQGRVKAIRHDSSGRQLIEVDNIQLWVGGLSTSEKNKAFALSENIKHLVKLNGLERLGFLTLTFKDNVTDFKEAQRRFNSLNSNVLRKCFENYIIVVEPQYRGAVHYHLIVVCMSDIRTGFDFQAFAACQREFKANRYSKDFHALKKQYVGTASPTLRELWKYLRHVMARYHFGRAELLPIRSNAEGIANYVGKYLEKGSMYRGEQFKGARMVRTSRGWRCASQNFAWYESGKAWRAMANAVAGELGIPEEEFQQRCGRHWAFKMLSIMQAYPDATAKEIAEVLASGR